MLELGAVALLLVGLVVALAAASTFLLFKVLFWLVLLPVRLVLALLTIPALLVKWTFALVGFVVATPLLGLALLAGLVVLTIGMLG